MGKTTGEEKLERKTSKTTNFWKIIQGNPVTCTWHRAFNSTSQALLPLSATASFYCTGETLQLKGRFELCWSYKHLQSSRFRQKVYLHKAYKYLPKHYDLFCKFLSWMQWLSEGKHSFRPSFYLLGWWGAKQFPNPSCHEGHSLSWVSGDLGLFHMHSLIHPWAALITLLYKKGISTCSVMFPLDHWKSAEVLQPGQASDISHYYIAENCYSCTLNVLLCLRFIVNCLYVYVT